jgi:hypothetical protein
MKLYYTLIKMLIYNEIRVLLTIFIIVIIKQIKLKALCSWDHAINWFVWQTGKQDAIWIREGQRILQQVFYVLQHIRKTAQNTCESNETAQK